jgi:hypothetical protein
MDRYDENRPYSISSYVKGSIFLSQLNYVIGKDKLAETIKDISMILSSNTLRQMISKISRTCFWALGGI